MITIYYICPKCKRPSSQMKLSKKQHIPTEAEKIKSPHIAHEMLECPCGMVNTWFTLKEMRNHNTYKKEKQ